MDTVTHTVRRGGVRIRGGVRNRDGVTVTGVWRFEPLSFTLWVIWCRASVFSSLHTSSALKYVSHFSFCLCVSEVSVNDKFTVVIMTLCVCVPAGV